MMVHITRVTQVWDWTDAWIHACVKRLEQCHVVFRVSLSILIELHATHPSLSSKLGSPRRWYSHRFFVPRFTLFNWPPSVRIRTWLPAYALLLEQPTLSLSWYDLIRWIINGTFFGIDLENSNLFFFFFFFYGTPRWLFEQSLQCINKKKYSIFAALFVERDHPVGIVNELSEKEGRKERR